MGDSEQGICKRVDYGEEQKIITLLFTFPNGKPHSYIRFSVLSVWEAKLLKSIEKATENQVFSVVRKIHITH
jgi:hypothetical protein